MTFDETLEKLAVSGIKEFKLSTRIGIDLVIYDIGAESQVAIDFMRYQWPRENHESLEQQIMETLSWFQNHSNFKYKIVPSENEKRSWFRRAHISIKIWKLKYFLYRQQCLRRHSEK